MGCGLSHYSCLIAYWITDFGIEVRFIFSAFDERCFLLCIKCAGNKGAEYDKALWEADTCE